MWKKLTIIVFGAVFGILFLIGMAIGYYMALYNLDKTELLILGAFGFAFLTWVGSGVDLLGLLREWYREKRESERTPTIGYRGIFRTNERQEIHDEKWTDTIYSLRIELISGVGMVNKCQSAITVQQSNLSYVIGTWWTTPSSQISISKARPEYLELFRVRQYDDNTKPKHFVFYSAPLHIQQMQSYDILNNVLQVTLGSENGNLPDPYLKTIQNIMNEANVMSS